MPTVRSWTSNELRALGDVRHLLRFRAGTVRRRVLFAWAVAILGLVTLAIAIVPAFLPGAGSSDTATEFRVLIPTAFAGFQAASNVATKAALRLTPLDMSAYVASNSA